MPKRKRDLLDDRLAHHHQALSRKLKAAKGFERQRMAKRQRDPKSDPAKRARIEKEIFVLKSLDLHSAAYAHLCASLLKVKAVAESPKLPDEIKNGVPRPDISDEEKSLLHNVTSALYNQPQVRLALEKAVVDVCNALQVPVPDKKGKGRNRDKKTEAAAGKDIEEQPAKSKPESEEKEAEKKVKRDEPKTLVESAEEDEEDSDEDESEFGGFSDDEGDVEVEAKEEKVMSRFNDRLGSSDGEDHDTADEELDPMEITDLSASEDSDDEVSLDGSETDTEGLEDEAEEEASEDDDSEEEENSDSDSGSSAISSPPKASKASKIRASSTLKPNQYALPTLMGGYISDSQSEASDIDVAPARKNRRGQRARQAIAEKKFKDQAKHLAKQQAAGRDDGWDMKRGAVSANPWKKGVRMPFGGDKGECGGEWEREGRKVRAPRKKDDEGPLHASWEAAKKAKEVQETAVFAGTRVVFD